MLDPRIKYSRMQHKPQEFPLQLIFFDCQIVKES